jgi:glycolate oxidase
MKAEEAYREFVELLGEENVSREPAVLDCYAWQPTFNDDPDRWVKRPVAVVLPASTEEVQEVVRICNRHGLRFKSFSTGWGAWNGPTFDNVVQVDLRRMDRIVEIDAKNMYAVIEPYVNGAQLQAEAMKVGLNTHIIGAGPNCSPLASATSGWGVGHDSIYMSYSARNLLGVEWVLPDGEVLRLGTLGTSGEWFNGDGPGPSLRGIMRGSCGALAGLGIFTRCALKLYNWPGPPLMDIDGIMLDAKMKVPENVGYFMCFFPDRKSFSDAMYKIGEAEIAYNALRTSFGGYLDILTPRLFRKLEHAGALRSMITRTFKFTLALLFAAESERELDYQKKVLHAIMREHGAFAMDVTQMEDFFSMLFMSFVRATIPALVFRMGGSFSTALDRNDALDSQVMWGDLIMGIKEGYIAKGQILDDMADNPYFVPYENNTWCHCEVVYQYDPRDPKHREALEPIFLDVTIAAIEHCMEPLFTSDPRVRKLISPLAGNFSRYQQAISRGLDPNQAADNTLYSVEADFDFSGIDPDRVKRLEEVAEQRKWQ